VAECQFAQSKYSWAQDSYGRLLEKYPSTRHLDAVTRRLFYISRVWLGVPETAGDDEQIQLVSHSDDGGESPMLDVVRGPSRWAIVPNLFDRTRPVFDTDGRAMQALEAIWQHDATGPLADDALMLQATYYQRKGDYVEAARLYQLIREQYPDSSHFKDAYILGSHVTLASYSGPAYDGKSLEKAKQLKEQARHLFADLTPEQKQRLEDELTRISEAEVEREWAKVEFYQRKRQPASVALHCNQIINRYPDSKFAKMAWDVLQRQQKDLEGSRPRVFPGRGERSPDGPVAPSDEAEAPYSTAVPNESSTEGEEPPESPQRKPFWRGFGNFLRPVKEPPALQPVEPGRATLDDDADPPPATGEDHPARVFLD